MNGGGDAQICKAIFVPPNARALRSAILSRFSVTGIVVFSLATMEQWARGAFADEVGDRSEKKLFFLWSGNSSTNFSGQGLKNA